MILWFYKVVPKWVKWNFANKYGVYAYIRSMGRDRVSVEHTRLFFATTTPRRWIAIGMGADRYQTAIGSLSTAGVPIPLKFGHRASRPRSFFMLAISYHIRDHTRDPNRLLYYHRHPHIFRLIWLAPRL